MVQEHCILRFGKIPAPGKHRRLRYGTQLSTAFVHQYVHREMRREPQRCCKASTEARRCVDAVKEGHRLESHYLKIATTMETVLKRWGGSQLVCLVRRVWNAL